MLKVVISQHSYPHDAGHSEVPTHIKHYRRDIEYPPLMLKGHYDAEKLWLKVLPLDSQIQERRQVNARPETPFSKAEMQNIISSELSFV